MSLIAMNMKWIFKKKIQLSFSLIILLQSLFIEMSWLIDEFDTFGRFVS